MSRITSYNVCYTKLLRLQVVEVGSLDTPGHEADCGGNVDGWRVDQLLACGDELYYSPF